MTTQFTRAKWAHGTQLIVDGVKVAELQNIGTPQLTRDEEDVTNHDSPGGHEEFIMTLMRSGTLPISGNFVAEDPGQQKVISLFKSAERVPMSIKLPDDIAEWQFEGFVKELNMGELGNGKIPFNASLRVSGMPKLMIGGVDVLGVDEESGGVARGLTVVAGNLVTIVGGYGEDYNDITIEFDTGVVGAAWSGTTLTVTLVAGTEYGASEINDLIVNAGGLTPAGVLQDKIKISVSGKYTGTEWSNAPDVILAGGS